jgi:hypothetical protein
MTKYFYLFGSFLISIVFLTFASTPNYSQPASQQTASQEQIESLIVKSGIVNQLEQLPQLLETGISQAQQKAKKPLSKEVFDKLNHAVRVSFDPKAIQKTIQEVIAKRLNKEDIDFIMNWLNSPFGEKITKMEESASTAEAYTEMQNMKEALTKDTARVSQIQKLDEALHGTESNIELGLKIQFAMAASMTATIDPNNPELLENISKKVEANRPKMTASIKEDTLVSYLYMYRTLDANELEQYISFAKLESSQKYYKVLIESLSLGIIDASRNVGKMFAESTKNSQNEKPEDVKVDEKNSKTN